jgi:sulfite reductase alpha subunit-like flavoprotein
MRVKAAAAIRVWLEGPAPLRVNSVQQLVVYFSRSGHTEQVAREIAARLRNHGHGVALPPLQTPPQ